MTAFFHSIANFKTFILRRDGGIAIEFAFVLPAIFVLLLSTIAVFDGIRASSMITRATATAIDLTTRSMIMTDNVRDSILATTDAIAGRYAEDANLTIVVTSVFNPFDTGGDPSLEVDWSFSNVPGQELTTADLSGYDLPTVPESDSVILVVAFGDYAPSAMVDEIGSFRLEEVQVRRPRFAQQIEYP